jgi:polyvinyl alcohol dehydrogenase (cytochrome)
MNTFRLVAFLAVAGSGGSALADGNWPQYNHDPSGSRANDEETILSPATVPGMHIQWAFQTSGLVTSTPVVVDGTVYAGDATGALYAVNPDGTLKWRAQTSAGITASAIVAGNRVVVGDQAGYIYGFKRNTGELAWTIHPLAHPLQSIWGSATKVGANIAIGVASNEEPAAASPGYPCCSTIGAVLLIDPNEGKVIWQTNTITAAQLAAGSSGSTVWSTPTYDAQLGLIFVTTGNNFSNPSTSSSDAIMALNAKTGAIVWSNQRTADDVWNYTYPGTLEHPDFDFGDSPQVYKLSDGTKVVGAGQKSGFYHVLNAATGAEIAVEQYEPGDTLGGLFSDSAVSGGVVFANGNWWPNPDAGGYPYRGDVIAIAGDGTQELWRFSLPYTANLSGVAVANGVVYFASAFTGTMYALNASTGALINSFLVGAAESGPAVSNGHVYVGSGEFFTQPGNTPSYIYCFGL